MKKLFLYPHNPHSKGAKGVAEAVGASRIKHDNSKLKGSPAKVVINWGSSKLPAEVLKCSVKNPPDIVTTASNKLSLFKILKDAKVPIPPFTADLNEAKEWSRQGHVVFCRTILNGSGGRGIVIAEKEDDLVIAPLYTRYIKKKDEYRIHGGKAPDGIIEIFDIQKKAKRLDEEPADWRIRNLENGFIYKRSDVVAPDAVLSAASNALLASNLDFGAVDVIWNNKDLKAYVLEINTAPGLEGQTLESYKGFLSKFLI